MAGSAGNTMCGTKRVMCALQLLCAVLVWWPLGWALSEQLSASCTCTVTVVALHALLYLMIGDTITHFNHLYGTANRALAAKPLVAC
jgi:hypothetical protein